MTNYYKHLCETLNYKINQIEQLMEVVVADQNDRGLNPENFKGFEKVDDRYSSSFKRRGTPSLENDNPLDNPEFNTTGEEQQDSGMQNVNPALDDRYTSAFAPKQNTLGLPPMRNSKPQQSLADKLFGKPLNEIKSYTDEERADPVRKAKEFRDAARLIKIAKAHNRRSGAGFPDKSPEFGKRLTAMLRAKGIDATLEQEMTGVGTGNVRSTKIFTPDPVVSAMDVEETEDGKFKQRFKQERPIEQQTKFDIDAVPQVAGNFAPLDSVKDEKDDLPAGEARWERNRQMQAERDRRPPVATGRRAAEWEAEKLMKQRRDRINSENERIAKKNAFVDQRKSWNLDVEDESDSKPQKR